ncbi:hypothetical protein ACFWHR_03855 [Leucobacter sp. NPDC058333]|uniref:hypothetical protein n=1 Tax=Leucobacter sp. NPDC058333 TaxID=3346450 RepID=UPI00365CA3EC
MAIPGFPSNDYDWNGGEVGAALAGVIVRDTVGAPRPGVLPSRANLVVGRSDWAYDVHPHVVVRVEERTVLIGASVDLEPVPTSPAPNANARIDVVYSRPADVGAGEPVAAVFVAQGLAAAIPQKPALPVGAVELATFRVSAGNANTSQAVPAQTFATTVCAGGVIPFRTTAERDAFLAVPGQFGTVGSTLYQRVGTAWVRAIPPLPEMFLDTISTRSVAAGASVQVEVKFPDGTFSGTPTVTVTPWGNSDKFGATVGGITSKGCTVALHNHGSVARTFGAQIIAMKG